MTTKTLQFGWRPAGKSTIVMSGFTAAMRIAMVNNDPSKY